MAEHIEAKDCYKFTALYVAVDAGHLAAMKTLLSRSANVWTRDIYEWTLLHRAAYRGYYKIVLELLSQINAEVKTYDNWTPLHEAAYAGHLEVVTVLIENEADIDARTIRGFKPIDLAFDGGHVETVRYLRSKGASEPSGSRARSQNSRIRIFDKSIGPSS